MNGVSFNDKWGINISEFGFTQVPFALLANSDLTVQERFVLVLLMSYGKKCIAKTSTLSSVLGHTERAISKNIDGLVQKGYVNRYYEEAYYNGVKRKFRVLDTSNVKAKLNEFIASSNLLDFLTKVKQLRKKKRPPTTNTASNLRL